MTFWSFEYFNGIGKVIRTNKTNNVKDNVINDDINDHLKYLFL